MKFRTRYEVGEKPQGLRCDPENDAVRVQQHMAQECDINYILSRYEKTGALGEFIKENPQYGDFSNVPTYQEALEVVAKAQEQFAMLSAKVRSRFENDPAQFLEFATNAANQHELISLGLAKKIVDPNSPNGDPTLLPGSGHKEEKKTEN